MIKCKNSYCIHHDDNDKCELKKAYIGTDARCENFEKGFMHYFYYFIHAMSGNFITTFDMSDDMRYCIYYLMKCLPIVYSQDSIRGLIVLRDRDNTDRILSKDDILDMIGSDKLDSDTLQNCIYDFIENGLPTPESKNDTKEVVSHGYGWLSPTAKFMKSPWGTHEETAEKIVNDNEWGEEYNKWLDDRPNNTLGINFRDFLTDIKGYVLIHSPSNIGYYVNYSKKLTKKQREFLYNYFHDMDMTDLAERYLDDE